jgi:hypothetical protein
MQQAVEVLARALSCDLEDEWEARKNDPVDAAGAETFRVEARQILAEIAPMIAQAERAKLHKMHRRAQKAEGLSQRSAALLETIMLSIKEVIPLLPTLPSPYPLSLHTLFHRVRAARDHARASSGRAFIEGYYYYGRKLKAVEAQIAAITATPAPDVSGLLEALREISDRHIPDQPAAYGGDEADWAQRQHTALRAIARAALARWEGR